MPVDVKIEPWWQRVGKLLTARWKTRLSSMSETAVQDSGSVKPRGRNQLRTDMIRRVEGAPKLVDPSGWISEGVSDQQGGTTPAPSTKPEEGGHSVAGSEANTDSTETQVEHKHERPPTPEQLSTFLG